MSNLKDWLWLSALRGVGRTVKLRLLGQLGTPEAIRWADEVELAQAEADRRTIDAIQSGASTEEADRILGDCHRLGLRILTIQDTEYPDRLKSIYDPPLLLYVQGRMPVMDEEVAIAMVGTRDCSPYGILAAETLSHAMAKQGALIVSGLARGVDAAAHRGALLAGGLTAAVLGNGHDVIYPPENRRLYEDIAASGVILSEYPPGTRPEGRNFPVRNRIISGLCLATVVVEAPFGSGALITAETALEQGRDVFAVPGPITARTSQGANRLIRDGAGVAGESWDVLREYAGRFPHKLRCVHVETPKTVGYGAREAAAAREAAQAAAREVPVVQEEEEPALPPLRLLDSGLTDDQIAILRCLRELGTAQVDDIIEATQIPARRALSALTLLELEEQVRQESGKRFALAVTLIE